MTLPLAAMLQGAVAGEPTGQTYVDDVFSTYLYTGNYVDDTNIVNGIDLAGKGGMVWIKGRNQARDNVLYDTARGADLRLVSNSTAAQGTANATLTAFNSNGFEVGHDADGNYTGYTYASWTFRKATKFFGVQTATLGAGNATVSFPELTTLGMVAVKRTDSTGDWYVWHRSLTAGKLVYLNQTAAEATLGHITVSGTTVTLVDGTLADGDYVVYAWAHDTGTDGIIQAGSFTTDGSGNATVTLGWEPQYVLMKRTDVSQNWFQSDVMRGWVSTANASKVLIPNATSVESTVGSSPTATGFTTDNNLTNASATYIYLAIRRPNKPPTSGTQVYNAITYSGNSTVPAIKLNGGYVCDFAAISRRTNDGGWYIWDRLRGANGGYLTTLDTAAEVTNLAGLAITIDQNDGITIGKNSNTTWNATGTDYAFYSFRRAPGVFDTFCDTGTGSSHTITHGLGAIPELWIRKGKSGATSWMIGSSLLANTEYIICPSPNGKVTDSTVWNSTYPDLTTLSVGTSANINTNAATYVTYLWATKAGISKVFTYTGDGGSGKVIDCGFTTGARFILIIRTTASTAQDIFIWDSARGIVAGNDPHLSLNTTVAEVTTDDSVDPDNSGFAVNQVAATNINVNGAVYIGLAYA